MPDDTRIIELEVEVKYLKERLEKAENRVLELERSQTSHFQIVREYVPYNPNPLDTGIHWYWNQPTCMGNKPVWEWLPWSSCDSTMPSFMPSGKKFTTSFDEETLPGTLSGTPSDFTQHISENLYELV